MKKIFFTFSLFAMTLMAVAQEPVLKARSIYDVNQDDKVTVQDVPALANKLLGKAEDKTAVDTQSLLDVLNNLAGQYANIVNQYGKILAELAELKANQCSCTCSGECGANMSNMIAGTFSVSEYKKVQFTKGNLYWDGSAFHFEANQTDYPTEWNPSHVGHFYWTSSKNYNSGNTNYMPYTQSYSLSSRSTSDKFFCDEENSLTVDGMNGCFTLSKSEWDYLINRRSNATNLHKYGVTVGDKIRCLIIAPDCFSSILKDSYTLDEINSLGLVCLPAAGGRNGLNLDYAESNNGTYWSSTPDSSDSGYAWILSFVSGNTFADSFRDYGRSLRLVRLAQ